MSGRERVRSAQWSGLSRFAVSELGFVAAFATATMLAIVTAAVTTGALYHSIAYGSIGPISSNAGVGIVIAMLYLLRVVSRNRFRPEDMLRRRGRDLEPELTAWLIAFMALLVVAFATKTTAIHSRGWLLSFFIFGLAMIPALALLGRRGVAILMRQGRLLPRRVVVVGFTSQLSRAIVRLEARGLGTKVVGISEISDLRPGQSPEQQLVDWKAGLSKTVAAARQLAADDIVLAVPLAEHDVIDRAIEAFSMLPVAVYLDAGALVDRLGDFRVERVGRLPCLAMIEPPMRPLNAFAKRIFDVVVSFFALIALAPIFGLIACLVKIDSRGPVFFRQRRLGYNQNEFRIFKFRSMTTLDDGATVVQAKRMDVRITRVGRWLRRTNLDELPQLVNVLLGEMSIVGPRPHAVAHDRHYEVRIGAYSRRLNVKPGITGWAQIHGLRGETDTEDKMQRRVEHDLFYIDNWSLGLDVYILIMTVLSRRTFQNAY